MLVLRRAAVLVLRRAAVLVLRRAAVLVLRRAAVLVLRRAAVLVITEVFVPHRVKPDPRSLVSVEQFSERHVESEIHLIRPLFSTIRHTAI